VAVTDAAALAPASPAAAELTSTARRETRVPSLNMTATPEVDVPQPEDPDAGIEAQR
jgi:hypothetical protein